MQKAFSVIKVCDFITKYSIYALVFLVPIFFLPWTTDVFDFNKQMLLILLVFLSFLALMLKIIITGKLFVNKSPMHMVVGVVFLAYLLATIFSSYKYGSFWGIGQQTSESLVTVTCLVLVYFIISSIFFRRDILISVIVLSFSAVLAELLGVLQLTGFFLLPFDFAKSASFNTLGSAGSLGIFSAVLLPLAMVLLVGLRKWWKALYILQIILSTLVLVLVDYPIIWWIAIIGSALVLILGALKSNYFDGKWMALPMFFTVVSLFFVLVNPQISWLPQKTAEVFLAQKSGLDIAVQTIKERPIFGSGPGTFAFDFLKFKSPDFSQSYLWNMTFNRSSSKVLTDLATLGIFGLLAFLAFMIVPVFYGAKMFISRKKVNCSFSQDKVTNRIYSILLLGLFVGLIIQIVARFVYNSGVALDFLYFFITAILIVFIDESKKEHVLKQASPFALTMVLIFTLAFITGVGILILAGQRYLAEANYYKGLTFYQSGQKAEGLKKLEAAAGLNPMSDVYFRQLSQAYLLELQDALSGAETTKIETLVSNSVNAAKVATDLNPQDVNNWSLRGYIYQSLIGISNNAHEWAMSSYDTALKLDPNNPYLFFQEGNVNFISASTLGTIDNEQRTQLLALAQAKLEKAITLNPNYSDALYSLGLVYDASGQKDKAINVFMVLQQINPENSIIQNILDNLKAGKPALSQ